MPYPSPQTLAAAAADLAGSHPLTIVTIPALLRAGREMGDPLAAIAAFGTKQERPVLESFRLRTAADKPYLAVWQEPPVYINKDYPGSTLQRLRTQDEIGRALFDITWNDDHSKRTATGLKGRAGAALTRLGIKRVNRLSLALWLGRDQDLDNPAAFLDWFDAEYPLNGTDLADFYVREMPGYIEPTQPMDTPLWIDQATNENIIEEIKPLSEDKSRLEVPSTTPPKATEIDDESGAGESDDSLQWTRDFCAYPLRDANIGKITQGVLAELNNRRIVFPEAESLIRRCVTALLVGHLVLQGPPGTGKTTLARILAEAFNVNLLESTATAEWSPFHVVGGLRPASDGSLQPSYGKVADAALKCAVHVRADVTAEAEGDDSKTPRLQGTWLLIDEFNRADIDKAIGSLYTMLASADAANLERSPIDLWFESETRQQLWVPSRFRIIAAMNDLDTSFVNRISQGLTRRFQFITVGAPDGDTGATDPNAETLASLASAYEWLSTTYGAVLTLKSLADTTGDVREQIITLQKLIGGLRLSTDTTAGWPVGTAQIVDVLRVLLLQVAGGEAAQNALDWGVADRLVPQMGQLDELQLARVTELFRDAALPHGAAALQHLVNPHGI